jgi:hypothetical protein
MLAEPGVSLDAEKRGGTDAPSSLAAQVTLIGTNFSSSSIIYPSHEFSGP